ncbi:MAG TPA: hypothetical protein VES20_13120 [Bryobacteraceae bacterium]|nr:hypothetical protein [Bryobacteraceae bacterium]
MPSQRYAAALAIAAGAVLAVGSYLRRPEPPKKVEAAPPAFAVRGSEMRQISDYLADRARRTAPHLVWVPSAQATGVRWTTGQVVTSGPELTPAQVAVVAETAGLQPIALASQERFEQGGWVVLAARNPEGNLIFSSGLLGGTAHVSCGGQDLRKLLFNTPLDEAWAGAGVFDVSGAALGMVVRCQGTWTALTHDSVQRLLESQPGADALPWQEFGIRIRQPSDVERKALRIADGGIFVSEVRTGSRADVIGILPGDLLLQTGNRKIASTEDVLALEGKITLQRNGRRLTLPTSPAYRLARSGYVTLTAVAPGSRHQEAGLRSGDEVADPALLDRKGPVWLVVRRDGRLTGVLLP